jgi:hypothetical protein
LISCESLFSKTEILAIAAENFRLCLTCWIMTLSSLCVKSPLFRVWIFETARV